MSCSDALIDTVYLVLAGIATTTFGYVPLSEFEVKIIALPRPHAPHLAANSADRRPYLHAQLNVSSMSRKCSSLAFEPLLELGGKRV